MTEKEIDGLKAGDIVLRNHHGIVYRICFLSREGSGFTFAYEDCLGKGFNITRYDLESWDFTYQGKEEQS